MKDEMIEEAGRIVHGINCDKAEHISGEMHGSEDDTPYLVDGCFYCGRCHHCLDTKEVNEAKAFLRGKEGRYPRALIVTNDKFDPGWIENCQVLLDQEFELGYLKGHAPALKEVIEWAEINAHAVELGGGGMVFVDELKAKFGEKK